MKEYEYLLSSQKQNLETKNTWEAHFNKRAELNHQEYEKKIKEMKAEHEADVVEMLKLAIENKTHGIAFFSSIKNGMEVCPNDDPQSTGKLVASSVWKFVPIDKMTEGMSVWKRLITKI